MNEYTLKLLTTIFEINLKHAYLMQSFPFTAVISALKDI